MFLKILIKIRTFICFISKLFGALTLKIIIKHLLRKQNVFMHTIGRIFEEDLNCLSLTRLYNVRIGEKMSFMRP